MFPINEKNMSKSTYIFDLQDPVFLVCKKKTEKEIEAYAGKQNVGKFSKALAAAYYRRWPELLQMPLNQRIPIVLAIHGGYRPHDLTNLREH